MDGCPKKKVLIAIFGWLLVSTGPFLYANLILSTGMGETLGGLTFRDGDLAEYDPVGDTASLYFDENLFSSAANIDALFISSAIPAFGGLMMVHKKRHK